ncbi:MAG: hypothetical protein JWL60_479, partial [Gemmatimonadetes bacterium]|nr:hypothetical protein [Gemmatimonadota bacterium]
MTACTFCGRENDTSSRFCIDCGKPVTASAARSLADTGSAGPAPGAVGSGAAAS